jgi:hypothetical protein
LASPGGPIALGSGKSALAKDFLLLSELGVEEELADDRGNEPEYGRCSGGRGEETRKPLMRLNLFRTA